jgi:hypothetical protein
VVTEVEESRPGYSIRDTMDFLDELLRCCYDFSQKHPDGENIHSLRLDLIKSTTEPQMQEFADLLFRHQWHVEKTYPSGLAVSLVQRITRHFHADWSLVSLAFDASSGSAKLLDGYQILTPDQKPIALPVESVPAKPVEEGVNKYLAAHPCRLLAVHCLKTRNPRFGWMSMIQCFKKPGPSRILPMTGDPATTGRILDAMNAVSERSQRLFERVQSEPVSLDYQKGVMHFGELERKVKLISTFEDSTFRWKWEWDYKPQGLPPSIRGIREKLNRAFPIQLVQSSPFRPAFWGYIYLVPAAAAHHAGYPMLYQYRNPETKIDSYYAIEET